MLALSACGRIGFDATADGGTIGDGNGNGDGIGNGDGPPIDAAVTSGLRLHVTFEGAIEDVADNRPVTCVGGCPPFVPGRSGGQAGTFNGTMCLSVPDDPVFRTQTFTLALWMRTYASPDVTVFGKSYFGATMGVNSWELWRNSSNGIRFDSLQGATTSGGNIPLSTWIHVAATFNTNTVSVYVNGMRQQTMATSATQYSNDAVRIGCDLNTGIVEDYVIGELDDVMFYDRALSGAEIAALAQ